MTAPTPEALRHRRSARHWARSGLVGFTAASSAANVTVIMAVPGATPMRVAIAALAPVVLAVMSHLLTKLMQGELTVSGIPSGWYWSTAVAVAAIGAGAFWLSFDTLRRAAEPDHGGSAWVFPATLDLAIVVCTVALVVIARADEYDQRAVNATEEASTTTTATAAAVHHRAPHELSIQEPPRSTAAAVVPPAALVAVAEQAPATTVNTAAVDAPTASPEPVADPVVDAEATTVELPVTCGDEVVVVANHQVPVASTTTVEATVADLVEDPTTTAPEPATTTADEPVVEAPSLRLVDTPAVVVDPMVVDPAELVAGLVAAGRLQPDKEAGALDAMALVTADPRPSQRQIAEAAGIDRSIVKKLIEAADANKTA